MIPILDLDIHLIQNANTAIQQEKYIMRGADFADQVALIVGRDNLDLYIKKFLPLDDVYMENPGGDIYGYEALAFYVYTTGLAWHQHINEELWSGKPSREVQSFAHVLNGALEKLPPYRDNGGRAYRGYNAHDIEEFSSRHKIGEIINFPAFTSASFQEDFAFGGNVLFIIRSLTARVIWQMAADYREYEVLIPSDRHFLVVGSETRGHRAVIFLEEQQ